MLLRIKTALNKYGKMVASYINLKLKQLDKHPVLQLIVLSVSIILILEMLSRRSIFGGFSFILSNPLMFLYNILIVLFTLTFTTLMSRKKFFLSLVSTLWLALGIINFFLLGFRTTPLAAIDFYILKSVFGIIHVYVNNLQLVLIIIVFVIVLIALIYFWKILPKSKAKIKIPMVMLFASAALMLMLTFISLKVNALSTNFGNLAEAYSEYGFAYCFSTSVFDRGINEPDEYSEENIEAVLETIESVTTDPVVVLQPIKSEEPVMDQSKPNVIIVQLESFFDVNHLKNFTFSENPIPNFTELKETYSSGYLTVPSIGAGTANTEFEVLTGMNLDYFGAGEYPYKTILQTTTCESIGYNLDAMGYHSHAIHNNTGTFYDRNTVFQKLGFDSYSSIEYMNNIEYNPLGWAKDYILTSEILKELKASTARDLIYAISVQPHGKYPNKVVDENQEIQVNVDPNKKPPSDSEGEDRDFYEINLEQITTEEITTEEGSTEVTTSEESNIDTTDLVESTTEEVVLDESYKDGFEYYVNQLHETDEFIGKLITALKKSKEPTIVVFYGDHLPSMSFENEDLDNNNKFQTEYVLWSNYQMEPIKRDLNAYQLSAYVLERIGFDSGILTKFHQRYVGEADYETELEMLQYDMLYGDLNAFGGTNPYIEKPIQMGVFEIKINGVVEKGEVTFVEGENFTPWSVVFVNDEPKETLFIDEKTLMVPYEHFITESIYVAQVTDNNAILSQSKQWILID